MVDENLKKWGIPCGKARAQIERDETTGALQNHLPNPKTKSNALDKMYFPRKREMCVCIQQTSCCKYIITSYIHLLILAEKKKHAQRFVVSTQLAFPWWHDLSLLQLIPLTENPFIFETYRLHPPLLEWDNTTIRVNSYCTSAGYYGHICTFLSSNI